MAQDWRAEFRQRLPLLGHRNWIGVLDAAFPWMVAEGIEVVSTGEELLPVVSEVLQDVLSSPHLLPVVHLARELDFVPDARVQGVKSLRSTLTERLDGHDLRRTNHAEILDILDRVGKQYRILLLKTACVIPYTSVFFELDCRYWSAEAEAEMREAMA
ncbi:MAG: hypothetical protein K1X67_18360 [Fimbriimonadaceae bacterium]|nr:hypothetical protein [Fimbriimonadaceae bacterium]